MADALTIKHWDGPPLEAWRAWRPEEAAAQLAGVGIDWCVVGGWSIDLWLERETRKHDDLEIAILRGDFAAIRRHLRAFDLHSVGDGEVRKLAPDETPPADKHQNWVLDSAANEWRMDIMMEHGDARTWVFRRDPSITRAARADDRHAQRHPVSDAAGRTAVQGKSVAREGRGRLRRLLARSSTTLRARGLRTR